MYGEFNGAFGFLIYRSENAVAHQNCRETTLRHLNLITRAMMNEDRVHTTKTIPKTRNEALTLSLLGTEFYGECNGAFGFLIYRSENAVAHQNCRETTLGYLNLITRAMNEDRFHTTKTIPKTRNKAVILTLLGTEFYGEFNRAFGFLI